MKSEICAAKASIYVFLFDAISAKHHRTPLPPCYTNSAGVLSAVYEYLRPPISFLKHDIRLSPTSRMWKTMRTKGCVLSPHMVFGTVGSDPTI